MLTQEQILPFLDTCIRSYGSPSKYASISTCHRLVALALLRRHYRNEEPKGITCLYDVLPYSPETIRRAVCDGVDMDMIERVEMGDRRYKKIRATKLLVETFEAMHVESTD
jgi:hypothetical protein